jgi:hypothetical protein
MPTSPISSQNNSNRTSHTIPSFINPRHTLLRQHTETNHVSSLPEENSNPNQINVGNLLDLEENESIFEEPDIQPRKFSSSLDSQTNLLDDSDPLTSSTSIIFPSPFIPITIPEAEEKSSSMYLSMIDVRHFHVVYSTHSPFFFSSC